MLSFFWARAMQWHDRYQSFACNYLSHTVKTYVLHFQLSGSLSRLAEHYIANTRPHSTLLPICRIQSSSSKGFHCNTAELCNFSNNTTFSGLSPVIVGKCRICQHFLQLHGLHKRPGLLFELLCCAPLCCGVEAACTYFLGHPPGAGANSSYKVLLPPLSISASSSTITMPFKIKCTNLTQITFVSRKC